MKFFSIRYKFLAVIVALNLACVLAYLALAVHLFEDDKEAYVYDSNAALVASVAAEAEATVSGVVKTLHLAAALGPAAGPSRDVIKALFDADDDLVELAVLPLDKAGAPPLTQLTKQAYLDLQGLDAGRLQGAVAELVPELAELRSGEVLVRNSSLPGGIALLSVGIRADAGADQPRAIVAQVRQDKLARVFARSEVFTAYLIDRRGNVLAHPDAARVIAQENIANAAFISEILARPVRTGVKELTLAGGERRITAFFKLDVGGLVVVSEISREKAFAASRRLVERSALFALALIGASLLVSVLFARTLTEPINRLYHATRRIAGGDFNVRVAASGRDEIGALSTSFNAMAAEILSLIDQVRDRARMEKELETARIVQENLFPKPIMAQGDLELSGTCSPASECGGDWWGYFQVGDKLVVMIGDATGHGVPAALITAAAQACCTTIQQIVQRSRSPNVSPAVLMAYLNMAVFNAAKGGMNMTFFIATIDVRTGAMTYANASHEFPVVCRSTGAAAADGGEAFATEMLLGEPGVCLGESVKTRYKEHASALGPGDAIVWYTDGLVEGQDDNGRDFGERRLLKAVRAAASLPVTGMRDDLLTKARAFYGKTPQADDLTLVVLRRAKAAAPAALPKGA